MIEPVGEHRVAASGERGHDAEVRHVAGREQQRARQVHESRQRRLERVVRRGVAEDQVRSTRAHAVTLRALARRRGEPRIRGESQVVIAAKRHDCAAIDHDVRALRRLQHAPPAQQPLPSQFFDLPAQRRAWRGRSQAGRIDGYKKTALCP